MSGYLVGAVIWMFLVVVELLGWVMDACRWLKKRV